MELRKNAQEIDRLEERGLPGPVRPDDDIQPAEGEKGSFFPGDPCEVLEILYGETSDHWRLSAFQDCRPTPWLATLSPGAGRQPPGSEASRVYSAGRDNVRGAQPDCRRNRHRAWCRAFQRRIPPMTVRIAEPLEDRRIAAARPGLLPRSRWTVSCPRAPNRSRCPLHRS